MTTDEIDFHAMLRDLADNDDPYSWVVGVGLVTRTAGTIEGVLNRVDDDVAVLSTAAGERRVPMTEVENVIWHLESPGPE